MLRLHYKPSQQMALLESPTSEQGITRHTLGLRIERHVYSSSNIIKMIEPRT
jgi:hypothetical protein